MITADAPTTDQIVLEHSPARVTYRLNARVFWMMVFGEVFLLSMTLLWVVSYVGPVSATLPTAGHLPAVRDAVWTRLMGAVPDPLIEVQPGISVHESNVRGLQLDGTIYYYYVEGNQNFDPLSQGLVTHDQVEILLRDTEGPLPLVLYTIPEA